MTIPTKKYFFRNKVLKKLLVITVYKFSMFLGGVILPTETCQINFRKVQPHA